MRKSGLALFLLGASLLGLAFALQAQDLPETPYDESQIVACGHPPQFLTEMLQNSIQRMRPTQKSTPPVQCGSPTGDGEIRVEQSEQSKQPDFDTPTIPAIPLRC